MAFTKSSRHAKITGDFGEAAVLYYLSTSGFECARVDHTGIDLIARSPRFKRPFGISVKARSRSPGTEYTALNLHKKDFAKIEAACAAFGCIPYIGLVFDSSSSLRLYVLALTHLRKVVPGGIKVAAWPMSPAKIESYTKDRRIMSIEWQRSATSWWECEQSRT
jgi:hypothetical protein